MPCNFVFYENQNSSVAFWCPFYFVLSKESKKSAAVLMLNHYMLAQSVLAWLKACWCPCKYICRVLFARQVRPFSGCVMFWEQRFLNDAIALWIYIRFWFVFSWKGVLFIFWTALDINVSPLDCFGFKAYYVNRIKAPPIVIICHKITAMLYVLFPQVAHIKGFARSTCNSAALLRGAVNCEPSFPPPFHYHSISSHSHSYPCK